MDDGDPRISVVWRVSCILYARISPAVELRQGTLIVSVVSTEPAG